MPCALHLAAHAERAMSFQVKLRIAVACGLAGTAALGFATKAETVDREALLARIELLDQQLFSAYNTCDLVAFASLFASDVEFYHDTGGVTHTRDEVVSNTLKYICGKVRRELVPGTLRAYAIKDFGAIAVGEHRFCELTTGKCDGVAEFVIVWRQNADSWAATRVLSFGHRAAP